MPRENINVQEKVDTVVQLISAAHTNVDVVSISTTVFKHNGILKQELEEMIFPVLLKQKAISERPHLIAKLYKIGDPISKKLLRGHYLATDVDPGNMNTEYKDMAWVFRINEPNLIRLLADKEVDDKNKTQTVEIHYTQTLQSIVIASGHKKYSPRAEKDRELLRRIAMHFGNDDPKISGKPFRSNWQQYDYDKNKALLKLKNEILHNINRQLKAKEIPIRFELEEESINLRKIGSAEVKFV